MQCVPRNSLTIDQALTVLVCTPPDIAALVAGLKPAQLRTAPDHDKWSANDVLAHLRSCADVWGDCIVAITAEDTPTLQAVNPRTWIKATDYPEQRFQPSLKAFGLQRADLIALLEQLPPEGWSRTATVTGAGKPLERTVLSYAERLARHERAHLQQMERIVSAVRT